jgi:lipopolysaccharide transport system ATP-binding protein
MEPGKKKSLIMSVIKVEDISKQYRLGQIGSGTLSHDLNRWWSRLRGKEDPFLKVGEVNDRTQKSDSDYVWALKDINFEVEQGDVLGIIGRNGAGKSTLLKILGRTTKPTSGSIRIKGRVASLLEVGTGFHPDLSGRENVYLNGAILGMRKAEIKRKFDEIVDFAGVERYIDTPVKRYSSGMYVRLAFGVAAYLEPEILIVDEVLAVGDAEFQRKALGKMNDVSKNEGRTVLFVSHNMAAIASLCNRVLVMHHGKVAFNGSIGKGLDHYLKSGNQQNAAQFENENPKETDILRVRILNAKREVVNNFYFNEDIIVEFVVRVTENYNDATIGFRIKDQIERNVFTTQIELKNIINRAGTYLMESRIPKGTLVPNRYVPVIALHVPNKEVLSYLDDKVMFEIEETGTDFFQYAGNDYGCVFVDCKWQLSGQ